jgi:hypothetical protein
MKCYMCEKLPKPGGLNYGIPDAVGICQHCGIGICLLHSYRDNHRGSPFLCLDCQNFSRDTKTKALVQKST